MAVAVKVSRILFSNGLVADGSQYRRDVDFTNGDREQLGVTQWGGEVVTDLDGEGIAAGTLGFGGCPGEDPRRTINGRTVGAPDQTKGQGLGG